MRADRLAPFALLIGLTAFAPWQQVLGAEPALCTASQPASLVERLARARAWQAEGLYRPALDCARLDKSQPAESPRRIIEAHVLAAELAGELARYPEAEAEITAGLSLVGTSKEDRIPAAALKITRARIARRLSKYADGEQVLSEALATLREVAPKHQTLYVIALRDQGILHRFRGKLDESTATLNEALQVIAKGTPVDDYQRALTFHELGATLVTAGKVDEGIATTREGLAILDRRVPENHIEKGRVLQTLGQALLGNGRYDEAQQVLDRVLKIREVAIGTDHPEYADTLGSMAILVSDLGDYKRADELYLRALDIYMRSFGRLSQRTGYNLVNLGLNARDLGDLPRARKYMEEGRDVLAQVLGPDHFAMGSVFNNLSMVALDTGDLGAGHRYLTQALSIQERRLGPEHPNLVTSLINLGSLNDDMGDLETADKHYARAQAILEKHGETNDPSMSVVLSNRGEAARILGRPDEARAYFERAIDIDKALYTHPTSDATMGPAGLARLARDRKDWKAAQEQLEQIRQVFVAAYDLQHPDAAEFLSLLAEADFELGQRTQAQALSRQALALSAAFPEARPRAVTANSIACSLASGVDETLLAIWYCKRAVNAVQAMRQTTGDMDRQLVNRFVANYAPLYRRLADLLTRAGRLAEAEQILSLLKEQEYFEYVHRGASGSADNANVSYTNFENQWTTRYEQVSSELAALGQEYAELTARQQEEQEEGVAPNAEQAARITQLRQDLKVAQQAFEHFMDQLRAAFKDAGGERLIEFGRKDLESLNAMRGVLKRLGNGAVLVHYLILEDELRILLTTPNIRIHRSVPISSAALTQKIVDFRAVLRDPSSDPRILGKELERILIEPIRKDLAQADAQTLMLYLDDRLRYLPWSALYDGRRYLVEDYALAVFTASARSNLERKSSDWTVAALGVSRGFTDFDPLPSVPDELDRIVRDGANDRRGVLDGDSRLDAAFTLGAFSAALQRPVVHVASHFKFKPGNEDQSFLLLGDGTRLTAAELRVGPYELNAVDLLTLSACDTALGSRDADGREIEGLAGLAQNQGAAAVLATLWPVADASTARLMERFYTLRSGKKLNKAEALRRAQLEFIRGQGRATGNDAKRLQVESESDADRAGAAGTQQSAATMLGLRHPYFWAPFILMGNWL